ncbi:hypothetical protein BI364_00615 [Acidihalobacter yilgarnensis]|uniref:Uncharacterized protein n=1 Tax=Acidihalobacter yilgarnensis TaxID=2819280 RepID=A0A1D8ISF9_9GAMM|nr:hypothetical protein [Acidihalobacter yilgarnensis]AOU99442.1 hypothetical protein BI364_00615 [Acidihalobacter yilgarnensis]
MTEAHATPKPITARSARNAATLFNYGNIVAFLLPFPLVFFWFGASMFIYAMNRQHPNPRVGYYTQIAAYRFYALTGFLVVAGTYFPPKLTHFLIYWGVSAAIMIPWSIIDLIRIHRERWEDTPGTPATPRPE